MCVLVPCDRIGRFDRRNDVCDHRSAVRCASRLSRRAGRTIQLRQVAERSVHAVHRARVRRVRLVEQWTCQVDRRQRSSRSTVLKYVGPSIASPAKLCRNAQPSVSTDSVVSFSSIVAALPHVQGKSLFECQSLYFPPSPLLFLWLDIDEIGHGKSGHTFCSAPSNLHSVLSRKQPWQLEP